MKCNLCIRKCNIDRSSNLGFCKMPDSIKLAKIMLYHYEEPCISGINGSGCIFFSGCNMKCIFCQNYEISLEGYGKDITICELANAFLKLQDEGAHNINLVTPGHFANLIKDTIILAKEKGLTIPIVYNTNGLETLNTIRSLDGLIDIYLPDFKYYDDKYALKYSGCSSYANNFKLILKEMYRQVGKNTFDGDMMIKGVLVRHLLLPSLEEDSKKIIRYLYDTYSDNIYLSIMNQYTPLKEYPYPELNKTISKKYYENIIDYAYDLGIRNCFVQEDGTCKKSFIPNFKE